VFLKYQELYKHEVSSEAILQVLKLIILNGMVCLSIFNGGVVTCLLGKCNSWLSIKWLYVFWTDIPKHSFFFIVPSGYQENKCKVFEIIMKDLKWNCCEMMASMCLHMLTGVAIQNVGTRSLESILMITKPI
jgi:hypothetical protein